MFRKLKFAAAPANVGTEDPALEAFKLARLDELARLRNVGIDCAERINLAFGGKLSAAETGELAGKDGLLPRFFRTERAVRQIVVLEMELLGLRVAPNRNRQPPVKGSGQDMLPEGDEPDRSPGDQERERSDYHTGAYDEVVARVRRDLRVEAPANDPFASPSDRKARVGKPAGRKPVEWKPAMRAPSAAGSEPLALRRKIVYAPVVTLGMVVRLRGDCAQVSPFGLKARYLGGEIGRVRGPPD